MKSSWMGGMQISEVKKRQEGGDNRGKEDRYGLKTKEGQEEATGIDEEGRKEGLRKKSKVRKGISMVNIV